MDQKLLTLVQALGMEKAAACDAGRKPPSYVRGKAKKKAVIEKISVDASSTPSAVDVIRIDATKAAELCAALQKLSAAQDAEDTSDEGNEVEPGTEYLATASDEKPKKAPKKKPEAVSENEVEYDKESSFGVFLKQALSPFAQQTLRRVLELGGLGAGLGGISGLVAPGEGETRLGSAGRRALLAGGVGAGTAAGGMLGYGATAPGREMNRLIEHVRKLRPKSLKQLDIMDMEPLIEATKKTVNHGRDNMLKAHLLPGAGTVLGSYGGYKGMKALAGPYNWKREGAKATEATDAADEKPKKAPKKQPAEEKSKKAPKKKPVEKESSFGVFLKQALGMGQPAKPLEVELSDMPLREGMKSGTRQDMFNVLSKWSLGRG